MKILNKKSLLHSATGYIFMISAINQLVQ